jgi:hypothetical protein
LEFNNELEKTVTIFFEKPGRSSTFQLRKERSSIYRKAQKPG